jgi:hypothetical protein
VLFLFAKHFFHSTTHHHRSASGLCPGLIGLVSLTPTHILLATHYYILTGGSLLLLLLLLTPFLFRQNNSSTDCFVISASLSREKKVSVCVNDQVSFFFQFCPSNAHTLAPKIMEPLLLSKIDRIFNSLRPQNHPSLHHST